MAANKGGPQSVTFCRFRYCIPGALMIPSARSIAGLPLILLAGLFAPAICHDTVKNWYYYRGITPLRGHDSSYTYISAVSPVSLTFSLVFPGLPFHRYQPRTVYASRDSSREQGDCDNLRRVDNHCGSPPRMVAKLLLLWPLTACAESLMWWVNPPARHPLLLLLAVMSLSLPLQFVSITFISLFFSPLPLFEFCFEFSNHSNAPTLPSSYNKHGT